MTAHASQPSAADLQAQEVSPAERRKALVGATAGHLIEWYDYGVYGFLAVYVGANFFISDDPVVGLLSAFAVFALSFFIRPLGGLFFGPLADRIGRRKTLMIVLGVMCGATMCIGLLPTAHSIGMAAPILLVLLRMVQGFSAGGEISTIAAFVSEFSKKGGRGLATSTLMTTAASGLMIGALVGNGMAWALGAEAMQEWGWRIPFLIAGPLGAIAIFIRMRLEDSPEFKRLHAEKRTSKAPLRETFRFPRQILLVMGVITLLASTFYLVMTYLTSYFRAVLALPESFIFWMVLVTGVLAAAFMAVGGHLSDRVGDRRIILVVGLLMTVASVAWFFLTAPNATTGMDIVPALIAVGISVGIYCGVPYATMTELLPTHVRSTGIAMGYNIPVAIFGGSAPFAATWLIDRTGDASSPLWFFLATAVISLVSIFFLRSEDLLGHESLAVTGSMERIDTAKVAATVDSEIKG